MYWGGGLISLLPTLKTPTHLYFNLLNTYTFCPLFVLLRGLQNKVSYLDRQVDRETLRTNFHFFLHRPFSYLLPLLKFSFLLSVVHFLRPFHVVIGWECRVCNALAIRQLEKPGSSFLPRSFQWCCYRVGRGTNLWRNSSPARHRSQTLYDILAVVYFGDPFTLN